MLPFVQFPFPGAVERDYSMGLFVFMIALGTTAVLVVVFSVLGMLYDWLSHSMDRYIERVLTDAFASIDLDDFRLDEDLDLEALYGAQIASDVTEEEVLSAEDLAFLKDARAAA